MSKNVLLGFVFLLLNLPIFSHAQSTAMTSGISWLKSNQTVTGSWNTELSSSTEFYTTVTVLEALINYSDASDSSVAGRNWLSSEKAESTTYLAPRIKVLAASGGDTAVDIATLLSYKNYDSGWGGYLNQTSNAFHTALALQTLRAANFTDQTILNQALAYLTGSQNADGGWGFVAGDRSNIYLTAIVSATLQQFPQTTVVSTAVSRAASYLLARQNQDGSFGAASTTYETVLALISLLGSGQTADLPLQSAVNSLATTQTANGSWNDDPYSTALAIRALYLFENRPS
ncbi:MAG: hypothetical protein HXX17_03855, partial [Geobacteraceae bacterium]|nr:hypothetical protein [Geobacteraceae bacterium]